MTNQPYFAQELLAQLNQQDPVRLIAEAQKRAQEAGHMYYSSSDTQEGMTDLKGEVEELEEAIMEGYSKQHIRNELGDVLFGLINVAQLHGLSFDEVATKMAERWLKRKATMEQDIQNKGYTWRNVPDDVARVSWKAAKNKLKQDEYK